KAYLDRAVAMLGEYPGIVVRHVSSYYETEPVGGPSREGMYLNAAVRRQAAETLGKFGPKARGAVAALIKALEDEDEGVRQAATKALKQISGEDRVNAQRRPTGGAVAGSPPVALLPVAAPPPSVCVP